MRNLTATLCLMIAVLLGAEAHGYDGPIFDAMAQIDEESGFIVSNEYLFFEKSLSIFFNLKKLASQTAS